MDKSVAELNIEHYRKMLATDLDAAKRETAPGTSSSTSGADPEWAVMTPPPT
jgi:hypothetical protein